MMLPPLPHSPCVPLPSQQPAAMDWDPEPEAEPEPEPEPAPAPPTLRPPSARLAACHPPPAAPTGPPMPLDSKDPMMLQQLQVFCMYFANSNFKLCLTWSHHVSHHVCALCAWLQLENMAEVSMERHGHAKQLVVCFGAASIGTGGAWGADAVLRACCKVVCRPRGTDQRRGRVVLADEDRTTRVSSAVNGQQPCESRLSKRRATRPADCKAPAGQVHHGLLRPAWSQQRDLPVRGMMWCPVVVPRNRHRPHAATRRPLPARRPTRRPLPAKRSKRTKAEPEAAKPTKGKDKRVRDKRPRDKAEPAAAQ
ncbi:hypothetical protein QJQ45_010084 [Haematococcus lacustris]|nr:hypothetical protein QJQ45_010084 [Haematococcus lacustris]